MPMQEDLAIWLSGMLGRFPRRLLIRCSGLSSFQNSRQSSLPVARQRLASGSETVGRLTRDSDAAISNQGQERKQNKTQNRTKRRLWRRSRALVLPGYCPRHKEAETDTTVARLAFPAADRRLFVPRNASRSETSDPSSTPHVLSRGAAHPIADPEGRRRSSSRRRRMRFRASRRRNCSHALAEASRIVFAASVQVSRSLWGFLWRRFTHRGSGGVFLALHRSKRHRQENTGGRKPVAYYS